MIATGLFIKMPRRLKLASLFAENAGAKWQNHMHCIFQIVAVITSNSKGNCNARRLQHNSDERQKPQFCSCCHGEKQVGRPLPIRFSPRPGRTLPPAAKMMAGVSVIYSDGCRLAIKSSLQTHGTSSMKRTKCNKCLSVG